jgi:Glycosyltransferase WbsX
MACPDPGGHSGAIRALAYYLPQFHRTPENDRWWGPGFTEWTTVRRARPLYRGHWQPRQPGLLGFYDLLADHVPMQQAELARGAGIDAFVYWHYWFAGRRLLTHPIDRVLSAGRPDIGLCLAWANESWTRVWTGRSRQVLLPQTYPGVDDHRAHYAWLRRAFVDPRYVRVRGRPVFVLYRPHRIPDLACLVEVWSEEAARAGDDPPYLVGELDLVTDRRWLERNRHLLDAVVELSWTRAFGRLHRPRKRLPRLRPQRAAYATVAERISRPAANLGVRQLPLVLTGWDNTPRQGLRGLVAEGYEPAELERAVARAAAWGRTLPADERIVLLKSWNEWSEGNYLEPDRRYGLAWRDACHRGLRAGRAVPPVLERR